MSSQNLLLGTNYLAQCQQLAHQAALAAAAVASSKRNEEQASSMSTSNVSHQSAGTTQQARKQQQQQSSQHLEWNQYQQALATAALTSSGGARLGESARCKSVEEQMRQQQQQQRQQQQQQQQQQHQQQQQLLTYLMNLASNTSPIQQANSQQSARPSPNQTLAHRSASGPTNTNKLCNQLQIQQQQLLAAMLQQQQQQQQQHQHQYQQQCSSLANLISMTNDGQLQFLQPKATYNQPSSPSPLAPLNSTNENSSSTLMAKLVSSSSNPSVTMSPYSIQQQQQLNSFDYVSLRLLESLFAMNDEPEDEAVELIAQRVNSNSVSVANWFRMRREAERRIYSSTAQSKLQTKTSNASNQSCSISPLEDDRGPHSSLLNYSIKSSATNGNNSVAINASNLENQIFNYSNLQQSILESVLGAAGNNNVIGMQNDIKSMAQNQSENESHTGNLEDLDNGEDVEDEYFNEANAQLIGEDLTDPKSLRKGNHLDLQLLNQAANNDLINFYTSNPFLTLINSNGNNKSSVLPTTSDSPISMAASTYKAQPPTVPSSTLLAKLNAVTSRPNAHISANNLDQKITDLLEAFYAINDNPEPAAIEMIAKRINMSTEAIGDWFDNKRMKTNPHAGPRSPPAKKREGGRVVTFSEYQRSLLEAIFDENNYLHPQEYEELSNLIQVPSRNIKIWFKNRRSKQRLSGRINTPGSANNSD